MQSNVKRLIESINAKQNGNQISNLLKVPISKSPPLMKSPTQSQLSIASTSKLHLNSIHEEFQKLEIRQQKSIEQSLPDDKSEDREVKASVNKLIESISNSRNRVNRQNTIIKIFDFGEINNEINTKYGVLKKDEGTIIIDEKKR